MRNWSHICQSFPPVRVIDVQVVFCLGSWILLVSRTAALLSSQKLACRGLWGQTFVPYSIPQCFQILSADSQTVLESYDQVETTTDRCKIKMVLERNSSLLQKWIYDESSVYLYNSMFIEICCDNHLPFDLQVDRTMKNIYLLITRKSGTWQAKYFYFKSFLHF